MNSSTFNSNNSPPGDGFGERRFETPHAALVAIAFVVAIECLALNVRPPFDRDDIFLPAYRTPTLVETIVVAKLNAADEPGPRFDTVILGDSSGLMGVDPQLLGRQTNQSVFNLSTISLMGVEGHRMVLDRHIKSHGIPTTVIYHFAPKDLHFSEDDLVGLGFLEHVKQWIDSASGVDSRWKDESTALALPSTRFRQYSQGSLSLQSARSKFRNQKRGRWGSHYQTLATIDSQDGFLAETSVASWDTPQNLDLHISDHHRETLSRLLDYMDEQGIRVHLVANPLPKIAETETTADSLSRIQDALKTLTENHERITILFPTQRYFSDDAFATLNHLRPEFAATNTLQIVERLTQTSP